jgi:hypothetical protein
MRQNRDRNLYSLWMGKVLCLFALSACSTVLLAQQTPDQQQDPSTQSQDVKPAILAMPSYSQNIALLGTDQRYMDLETLQTRRRTFFIYGMGVSETYDYFGGNSAVQNSNLLVWSPHFAIINASNHSSFSVQYAPSVSQSTSGPSSHQVFQSGAISFGEPIARNWVLQLSSSNTYGTDSSRLVSPLAFNVNQGVPVVDPNSAVFQFNRGDVLTTANDAVLIWQRSPSQSMNFTAGESTLSSLDGRLSNTSTFTIVSYSAAVSQHTSLNVGGNYYHRFSLGSCDSYGLTFGFSHQLGRNMNLSLAGGPEFETAPCNKTLGPLGGNYAITIAYPLSRRSRVGLTASRSYATNYLANTQWTDTAAVSYSRQLSETFDISLNSGYARSVLSQTSLGTYAGYFAGTDLSWKLSRTVALRGEYRRFGQVSGGPLKSQNVAMITLGWSPLPTRIVK